ncbi:PRC and DUF2382 domain-containing protein [Cutibacterium equinum]|uniref:PRC and DUF2382 domain-containing protein n=1 Tax=Cutibacterium equinum TaxID=3016342 RepID=A0ABY7QXV1_9ACTN|nr:PRC and DUF2382 domain-containing protein [Cutibacterium equinum]WCC79873.1 PRC and DUF2382 domain-containing protein [Cutibacterium equinum]
MPTHETPTHANIDALYDRTVVDQSGDKIGEIGQVYLDDASGQPAWVTVKTGLFGRNETFVPYQGLDISGDQVRAPYSKDKVKDAPNVDPDGHLSEDETDALYRYYSDAFGSEKDATKDANQGVAGNGVAGGVAGQRTVETNGNQGVAGNGVSGHEVADANNQKVADTKAQTTADQKSPVAEDGSVVRHEERLKVGKERVETGRVRIRKHIVHDTETVQVPVEREEIHVERVPLDEEVAADDVQLSEGTQDIVTHEERAVVGKETVAAEKIRIGKDTTQGTQTVSGEVAKEQIDIDQANQPKNK